MFCVDKKEKNAIKQKGKISLDSDVSYSEYDNLDEIAFEWKEATRGLSIFFSYEYLKAVEVCPPSGMRSKYVMVYRQGALFAILYYQIKAFHASESIQFKDAKNKVDHVATSVKGGIAKMINFEGLVSGSLLLTGEYSYNFYDGKLSKKEQFLLAERITEHYRNYLNEHGEQLKVTFLKDFYEESSFEKLNINQSKYKEFSVQPNMILTLQQDWKNFDDYLAAMQSKYRVRARRARKKFEGIEKRELDYVDIKKYNARIYGLYRNIVENVNFNLFLLHEDYFSELKKNLKEKFRLFAYFKNDEMVAFYTCIDNGKEMNAHFLGYDPECNNHHQLYLNSLYDMIDLSLHYNFETINFSRTAMEIKSSVGAEPHDMLCYLKHQNTLINTVVAKIVGVLNPTEEWVQRNPFK